MMDKKQFLASGLIEQYALGLTSPEESRLVEHYVDSYPDVREKMNELQDAVEQYASQYAVPPPRRLKQRILSEIEEEELYPEHLPDEPDDIPIPSYPRITRPSTNVTPKAIYVSFAGTVLIALMSIGILLWKQEQLQTDNEVLSGELNKYRLQYNSLQKEQTLKEKIFDFIENGYGNVIHLHGTEVAADAHVVVYWNPNTQKSYVKLVKVPNLPSGKQLQLWADVDGEMINAGLLDNAQKDLQAVKYVKNANSLNITIEPLGGSQRPSVRLLIANGEI